MKGATHVSILVVLLLIPCMVSGEAPASTLPANPPLLLDGTGGEPAQQWKAALDGAQAAWRDGHHKKAEKLFEEAMDLSAQAGDPPASLAEVSHRFGQFYLERGKYPRAEHYLSLACSLLWREPGSRVALASVLDDLARLHYRWARNPTAPGEPLIGDTRPQRANASYEARPYQQPPDTRHRQMRLPGPPLTIDYRIKAALGFYRRALKLREEALGPNHTGVAINLRNIAMLELQDGDTDPAVENLARAVAIQQSAAQPPDLELAVTLEAYAKALRKQKRKGEARQYEQRAREIRMNAPKAIPKNQSLR